MARLTAQQCQLTTLITATAAAAALTLRWAIDGPNTPHILPVALLMATAAWAATGIVLLAKKTLPTPSEQHPVSLWIALLGLALSLVVAWNPSTILAWSAFLLTGAASMSVLDDVLRRRKRDDRSVSPSTSSETRESAQRTGVGQGGRGTDHGN